MACAYPRSTASLYCTWVMPGIVYSIGSSTVLMLMPSPRRSRMAEYIVVVLPLPVGPVIRTIPCGWKMRLRTMSRTRGSPMIRSSPISDADRSSTRMTTFSPNRVGTDEMRSEISRSLNTQPSRPSCGFRRSVMFMLASAFRRLTTAP